MAEERGDVRQAGLHRVCCDAKFGGVGNTSGARWEIYIAGRGSETWLFHTWPVSRRHQIPTIAERTAALAKLGYAPVPGDEWTWTEDTTPTYHGHPAAVQVFANLSVGPLAPACAGEQGAGQ